MADILPIRRLDDSYSLLDLTGRVGLYGEYAVHTIHRARHTVEIIKTSLKYFLSIPHQLTCLIAVGIPHQRAQCETFLLQVPVHGVTLSAGSTRH